MDALTPFYYDQLSKFSFPQRYVEKSLSKELRPFLSAEGFQSISLQSLPKTYMFRKLVAKTKSRLRDLKILSESAGRIRDLTTKSKLDFERGIKYEEIYNLEKALEVYSCCLFSLKEIHDDSILYQKAKLEGFDSEGLILCALNSMANVYLKLSTNAQSMKLLALGFLEEKTVTSNLYRDETVIALYNLGIGYYLLGRFNRAANFFQDAAKLRMGETDVLAEEEMLLHCRTLTSLGLTLIKLSDYQIAKEYLKEALSLICVSEFDQVFLNHFIGVCENRLGNIPSSQKHFKLANVLLTNLRSEKHKSLLLALKLHRKINSM
eukprot:snap_masked-scaffold_5-processed-gene-20.73-mRNA-1 protein AED:1.00 eAED:1.00 QI:0/0/0/0/1/1/2/0/320